MLRWQKLLIGSTLCSVLAAGTALADDGVTPELWLEHATPGGFTENYHSVAVADGQLDANVNSRYRLRWNGYASDQDVYEYLRANLTDVSVGAGKLEAHVFLRAGFDIDGNYNNQSPSNEYYFWRDILNAQANGHVGALSAYTANLTLKEVVPGTALTLGRTYVSHINTAQIDGGELAVGPDQAHLFVFAGRPVSFFFNTAGDWTLGGGFDLHPLRQTHIRAEYLGTVIESVHNDTFAVRVDQGYGLGVVDGNLYAEYRYIDGPSQLELSASGHAAQLGTVLTVRYRKLFADIGVDPNQALGFPVSPLTTTLGPYAQYDLVHADVAQPLTKNFLVSAGVDYKHANGDFLLDNRSYRKYRLAVDVDSLPAAGTHLQVYGESWNVDPVAGEEHSGTLHGGLRLSQNIMKGLDAWAGTSWQQFKFDPASAGQIAVGQEFTQPTAQVKQNVRNYYVGAQWAASQHVSLLLDFDAENSDVFSDLGSSSLATNYTLQAMINIVL